LTIFKAVIWEDDKLTRQGKQEILTRNFTIFHGGGKQKKNCSRLQDIYEIALDEIVEINEAGEEEVFDIQVDRTENFIANGLVSHNTRWHDDDLAGKLLERDGEKGHFYDTKMGAWTEGGDKVDTTGMREGTWDVISFPALAIENEKYRGIGDSLWEDKYDVKALEEIKRTVGVRDFSALYQQDPVDKEAQLFKEEWFRKWSVIPKNVKYFTAVDPAISKKKGADDSVVLTLCRDAHDNIYIVEIRAGKWNPSELINEIFQQQKKYGSRVGIEAQQYQYSLIHYMKQEQKARGIYIHVSPVSHYTNKEIRIQGLEPYYINGLIYHPPAGAEKLEEQLRRFPSGKHDDVIDALTLAVYLSTKPTVSSEVATNTIGLKWGKDGLPRLE